MHRIRRAGFCSPVYRLAQDQEELLSGLVLPWVLQSEESQPEEWVLGLQALYS